MDKQQNAKFAFFYMLSLVALVFTAVAAGMIVFQIINKKIVDLLSSAPGGFSQDALKFAISAIVIAAPVYFVMIRLINKNLLAGKLEKESGIRKWLTYFILLVSAVVMIGWLIATLNSFLNGELTAKFILKSATAIFIAAAIFSFYLYDIKRPEVTKNNHLIRAYYYGGMALVLAALVSGFFFVESPFAVRSRKFDETIINKFNQIDSAINAYYSENGQLPADLPALLNNGALYYLTDNDLTDPATNKIFDYKIDGKDAYELCATFKTSNKQASQDSGKYYFIDKRWLHDAGYQCLKQGIGAQDNLKPRPVPVPAR
ncbi:MAG: DUF5671 domain-containing protein [bacterium]|nr:DUF5671 domain-containing protein [bacterium]